jgi:hypothetical protein
MTRTTRTELHQLAIVINTALETPDEYFVQWGYGQPRLFRAGGGVEVSPRLPAGELVRWMNAFIDGIVAAHKQAERLATYPTTRKR